MTKSEYMRALQEKLQRYNAALQQEILEDYEQHFAEGMAEGRSEEEIIAELGNIEDMLQEFSEEDLKQEIEAVEAQASHSHNYEQLYQAVVIEGMLADVEVTASEDDQIRIDYDNRGNKAQKLRYSFYQYEKDGVFYAGVKDRKREKTGLEGLFGLFSYGDWSGGNIQLSVRIPSEIPVIKLHTTSGDLDIQRVGTQQLEAKCTSGDLRITDVSCGKLYAQTFSGELEIEDVDLSGKEASEIELHTTSGDLEARGLSADSICMQSASGDLSTEKIKTGKLQLQTASGELEMEDIQGDKIRLRTGSGDMDGQNICGAKLVAEAGSGDVALEADMQDADLMTGSGSIDLKACAGMRQIKLVAGSGDISLDLCRVEGASIATFTGSGDMVIRGNEVSGRSYNCSYGSGACQVKITTGSGDIEVL